jgi:AAA ATPase domain
MAQPTDRLVGRGAGLEALDGVLADLERKRSCALALTGEPGIGKTRLLAELQARADARGRLVLSGSASELERELPFWLFVDALDEYVYGLEPRRLDALDADVRGELAHVLPSLPGGAEPAPERYRTHRAVRVLLETLAQPKPLMLVLDDVHWADPGSIELLGGTVSDALYGESGGNPVLPPAARAVPGGPDRRRRAHRGAGPARRRRAPPARGRSGRRRPVRARARRGGGGGARGIGDRRARRAGAGRHRAPHRGPAPLPLPPPARAQRGLRHRARRLAARRARARRRRACGARSAAGRARAPRRAVRTARGRGGGRGAARCGRGDRRRGTTTLVAAARAAVTIRWPDGNDATCAQLRSCESCTWAPSTSSGRRAR